jgi:hypothetical protein
MLIYLNITDCTRVSTIYKENKYVYSCLSDVRGNNTEACENYIAQILYFEAEIEINKESHAYKQGQAAHAV